MPSSHIQVRDYSLIMMWPLAVRPCPGGPGADRILSDRMSQWPEKIRKAVEAEGCWKKLPSGLHHARSLQDIQRPSGCQLSPDEYSEFVYFYPFIQSFLFGRGDGQSAPLLTLYRHTEITAIEVTVGENEKERTFRLSVPRLNLYVFGTGDVFIVTEVSMPVSTLKEKGEAGNMTLTLANVLDVNECLRRAYAPYFYADMNSGCLKPGYALKDVSWVTENGRWTEPREELGCEIWQALSADLVADRPRNPLYAHWKQLLPRLKAQGLEWRQVQDDRMPAMTSVTVDDPDEISRGDWVRLANFDGHGTDLFPYSAAFLRDFEQTQCYDRFWEPGPGWMKTRYVTTGFGFAQVVQAGKEGRVVFTEHLRRHYFHMALISHFHQAALYNLSDQLATAVRDAQDSACRRGGVAQYDDWQPVARIAERMMLFTQAFWFPEVSNQVQAREMFAFMRRPLGVQALYDQVQREVQEASLYLNRLEDKRTAEATEKFNVIAAVGLALALTVGFLGMNIIVDAKSLDCLNGGGGCSFFETAWMSRRGWGVFGFVFIASFISIYLLYFAFYHSYKVKIIPSMSWLLFIFTLISSIYALFY